MINREHYLGISSSINIQLSELPQVSWNKLLILIGNVHFNWFSSKFSRVMITTFWSPGVNSFVLKYTQPCKMMNVLSYSWEITQKWMQYFINAIFEIICFRTIQPWRLSLNLKIVSKIAFIIKVTFLLYSFFIYPLYLK